MHGFKEYCTLPPRLSNPQLDEGGTMSTYNNDIRAALLEHVEAQVVFGDTKAALIVAADAILITGYVAGIKEFGMTGMLSQFTIVLLIVCLIILVAGLILALIAVMPNRRHWRETPGMQSLLLFSKIAQYENSQAYAADFGRLNDESLSNEILSQVYGKSRWALSKYKTIWWSVLLTIISVSLATFSIVLDIAVKWIRQLA
jgi:pycsar effector protein